MAARSCGPNTGPTAGGGPHKMKLSGDRGWNRPAWRSARPSSRAARQSKARANARQHARIEQHPRPGGRLRGWCGARQRVAFRRLHRSRLLRRRGDLFMLRRPLQLLLATVASVCCRPNHLRRAALFVGIGRDSVKAHYYRKPGARGS